MNDLRKFRRSLARMAGGVAPILARELTAGAEEVADEIRKNAPVDTGLTRDSVRVEPVVELDGRVEVAVVVDRDGDDHVVRIVEYGSVHQAPNPFIRRSLASLKEAVSAQVLRRTALGIEKLDR